MSSAIGTSIAAPSPSSSRLRNAAAMANAAAIPATLSATACAAYVGSPCIHDCAPAMPATACTVSSYAGRSA